MEADEIENLIRLANDDSPGAREALSEQVTALCLSSVHTLGDQEKEIAGHILIKLARDFEVELRARLANQLSASDRAPAVLVRALAADEIQVATPIIAQSPLLEEQDLIEIVSTKSREHQMKVAMRSGITAAVSSVLVTTDEPEVLEALAKNETAEIADAAMDYLVEQSQKQESLRGPLVARSDIPPALAHKMLFWVSTALKEEILTKFDVESDLVDTAIRDLRMSAEVMVQADASQLTKAEILVQKLIANGELSVNRMIGMLREKHLPLFLHALAALSGLDNHTIHNLALEGEGDGLAIVCRAIGADRSQFATMALLLERSRTGKAVPAARLQAICRLFDGLSEERAAGVIFSWRKLAQHKRDAA